jgi:hypothetical protein
MHYLIKSSHQPYETRWVFLDWQDVEFAETLKARVSQGPSETLDTTQLSFNR